MTSRPTDVVTAHRDALRKAEEAVRAKPTDVQRRKGLIALARAIRAFNRQNYKRAAELAVDSCEADGTSAQAQHLLALSLERIGLLGAALDAYHRAVALDPNDPDLYLNVGMAAWRMDMFEQAETAFRTALNVSPTYHRAWNNLAGVLRDQGRTAEAVDVARNAIYAMPEQPELWNMIGSIVVEEGEFALAQTFFNEALRLDPHFGRAWHNIAYAQCHTGDYAEAARNFSRALDFVNDPNDRVEALHARGLARLATGDFGGWEDYAARFDARFKGAVAYLSDAPRWSGEDLAGKRVLVFAEQGVGDEIMFASVIPDLIARTGPDGQVLIASDDRLTALFQRSFPQTRCGGYLNGAMNGQGFRTAPWADGLKPDLMMTMGDALAAFRTALRDFPEQAFLTPDPARVAHWRTRLESAGPGPYVGLCWRSMVINTLRKKYFGAIDVWGPVLTAPGVRIVNLQYGDVAAELDRARERFGAEIVNFAELDLKNDLDDAAALSAACDLVVSAPTAAAAMAAATGAETWFVTAGPVWPQFGSDRYPCYARTRVLHPQSFGDWGALMPALAAQIAGWARAVRPAAIKRA